MATIVLSAVGAAAGASLGGGFLGLSSVVIGRAIGATVGQAIDRKYFDQKLMGAGSEAVETGRVERFRLSGASEGAPVSTLYGRMRVAGQIIWASRFNEIVTETTVGGGGSGKGGPPTPPAQTVRDFRYSVSVAIALGEGPISRIGRIWADGIEISEYDLNIRVYDGRSDQMPDPKIEAVEGAGAAPSYRGVAYVVIEDLALADYGNRVPQFSFEVIRPEPPEMQSGFDISSSIKGVALIPGTGEYALATTPVHFTKGPGSNVSANINTPGRKTDLAVSMDALRGDLPNYKATSLIVSWFGDDLRCGSCSIKPKVEQTALDGVGMPWRVSGVTRGTAETTPMVDGRPVYGGTPTDRSVVEAIAELGRGGRDVMFYPFILMEQLDGNALTDPWSAEVGQPVLPWRGRITTSLAPGVTGSPDGAAAAEAEVAAFFGTAAVSDFAEFATGVTYTGPAEFSYRRFILHYAYLCKAAGGVAAFCIGSEMRGLTQIRGAGNSFPAVAAMRALAADVRAILGPDTKIGYAADWTEYFGYHPQDGSGDVFFHLDPLWADPVIDFVGIDNYMPISDWRDGQDHADADFGAIYNLDYLQSNIYGGEGFDWYYNSPEGEDAQRRLPITDGAYDEPWVFRYKDLKGWWENSHHERAGGVRSETATDWVPGMKPFWFTEFGCAAIDKGTNQPNKFLDPKSSESSLPKFSNGRRDDFLQMQYLNAYYSHFADIENNPVSSVYGGPMVDMDQAYVWAWDARPYPFFPASLDTWSDGGNYARGHWMNGRTSSRSLASVVLEICARGGIEDVDVSALYGIVRGYSVDETSTPRAALQPLMLAYGFDAIEREGRLTFRTRSARASDVLGADDLAFSGEIEGDLEKTRAPYAETAGRLRLSYIEAEGDYEIRSTEATFPDDPSAKAAGSELPLVLTSVEAQGIAERWLAEARIARDTVRFALPPSKMARGAGDVVRVVEDNSEALYRIDQVEEAGLQLLQAVRIEIATQEPSDTVDAVATVHSFVAPLPVYPVFLDLPLITGDEAAHAPHVAVTAEPWPGSVAVYASASSDGYALNQTLSMAATMGETETPLFAARSDLWDIGTSLRVRLYGGALASATAEQVLNGANAAAIGDGISDIWEVFQFQTAELIGENTYELSTRLRGQLGTDGLIPTDWPPGSRFVLLNSALEQISLAASERDLARNYRIGPSRLGVDDPTYVEENRAFSGIGLRPYAPAHLRAIRSGSGDLAVRWIRRTRIDGDNWSGLDVPLGEDSERYVVRVTHSGGVLRETTVSDSAWTYTAADQASDGVALPIQIDVAQISARFGPGLFRRIVIND